MRSSIPRTPTSDRARQADALAVALRDHPDDPRAADELLKAVEGFCRWLGHMVARRHGLAGQDLDDLAQGARLGVLRAARDYDPSRGRFLAYARRICWDYARREAESLPLGPIAVSGRAVRAVQGLKGWTPKPCDLERARAALSRPEGDEPPWFGHVEGREPSPALAIEERQRTAALEEWTRRALNSLDSPARARVASVFGLDGQPVLKQSEIARRLGISRQTVGGSLQLDLARLRRFGPPPA